MSVLTARTIDDAAYELMSGGSNAPVDNKRNALLWQYPDARPVILRRRREWLEWLTVTQRRWQRETRRPQRARHHDSVSIREGYVAGRKDCGRGV